ncbi:type VII secretion protein EccE [Wenjunlia vitaminophila]|uniref:Type VII secretion protein EccE n=1 Tax=Wenjunlia vitaminophila TaxID=76728 RepID=A0A0T6LYD8_WENVI|nr:type VII secretion protein EccE [Wenjunlia vitaminophila]KRV51048.1 type VII secretion protein EccE [Wenjunlia vitaminophila]
MRLQQVVLVEVAAALVLVGMAGGSVVLVPLAAVAAVLVVLAVVSRHRRPLPEWLGTVLALRSRRRAAAAEPPPVGVDPGLAPAVECDPALRTYTYIDRDHRSVGMVGDGTFLTVVLLVQGRDAPLRPLRGQRPLPLEVLHDALEVDDIVLASVQVVQHTQPAPATHLPEQSVAARSYTPLQAQTGTPGLRLTWVALKLDPELCPEAVKARGGGLGGVQRAVLRAADQLASRLVAAGFTATVLDEPELVSALSTSACANPRASTHRGDQQTSRRTVETSRTWRCDDRWHTTYWIGRWPQLPAGRSPDLVNLLTSVPTLASTFSLIATRGTGHSPALTGYVRLTARSDTELVTARRQLERHANGVRVGLVRLDREQLPGLLATLPLGGTR